MRESGDEVCVCVFFFQKAKVFKVLRDDKSWEEYVCKDRTYLQNTPGLE